MTTGTDGNSDRIRKANSKYKEPIPAGAVIQIPGDPKAKGSSYPGELEIKVWGERIEIFDSFSISSGIDAVQKGTFTVPNTQEFRDIFVPLSTPEIDISYNFEKILTGRCSSPKPNNTDSSQDLTVEFWSLPAILENSGPPITSFPLEYKKMNLIQIASDLCWAQSIVVNLEGDSGPTFKRVSIEPGSSSIGFIADLAKQRGFVLSSNQNGEMVIRKGAETGSPVMVLEKGVHPCESASVDIDESQYYSDVTGYVPRKSRPGYRHGEGFTVQNPYMTDVCRPFLMEMNDIEAGELEAATMALAGRMFAAVMSVSVELSTWTDSNGDTIKENTTVMLKSPGDFIYDFYEFLISDVTLAKTNDSRTASLKLVLPGVYSGKIPEGMPWQR